jgi:uncharacterized protein
MRVVVDTNVLVSAALKRNSTPATAVLIVEREGVLLKSLATERQLVDVLARPYFVPLIGGETRSWLCKLMSAAELVPINERISVCRDPTDDKFLELAVNGRADVVVSGDADLLALNPVPGNSDHRAQRLRAGHNGVICKKVSTFAHYILRERKPVPVGRSGPVFPGLRTIQSG